MENIDGSVWKYPFKTLKILNISYYQLLIWDTEVAWRELELENLDYKFNSTVCRLN